jgi:hypothetical protein
MVRLRTDVFATHTGGLFMKIELRQLSTNVLLVGILAIGAWSCANGANPGTGTTSHGGTTGAGGMGTGGSTNDVAGGAKGTGGALATGGVTVAPGSGGSGQGGAGTGGVTAGTGGAVTGTGGAATGTGGVQGAGGSTPQGGTTGNDASVSTGSDASRQDGAIVKRDGSVGTGGVPGNGGSTGTGGTTPTGGTTSTGACQKGQVKASEVVFMGESFYAIAPQYIETRVESNAQAAGALASGAKYRNVAVSGQTMNYVATTEWPAATKGGTVKNVIMDGGGIDCMSSSCSSCPGDFTTLLGKMATAGVTDVIYTRYPEPGSPPGSNATLKGNLDILMPKMQAVCEGSTSPRCHWVDLRPIWQTNDVLSDGLHPTQSGGNHVGDLLWSEMVKNCMAQ